MAEPEVKNEALRVDDANLIRKEPHFLVRLAGLLVSLALIAGAIYWAVSAL
ncbi:MAG: hypothetical protein ABW003_28380 [Microvirga sp.]